MTKINLFDEIDVPSENIFAVNGNNEPSEEAVRYSSVLKENVNMENGFPKFDLVMLGLGEDGHTASIFPDQLDLLSTDKICKVAVHPATKQIRISLTGKVINNAAQIVFLVTGKSKAQMVDTIINKKNDFKKLPASFVKPQNGTLIWMLNEESASLLDS
jgi:6-phosphogluconolactonase